MFRTGFSGASARRPLRPVGSLTVKDEKTGVEFPLAQKFWEGDVFRCLGAGTRIKKVFVVDVKVYTVSLYVEADKAAKELGIRNRGGFFETDEDYCQALMDGAFNKVLVFRLVRDVEGQQFADAISTSLLPRMQITGDTASLEQFASFFTSKSLTNNTEIVLFWNTLGDLEALVLPGPDPDSYATTKPEWRVRSPGLCRALFELFLGESATVKDARSSWVKGAKQLLESERVTRDTRKAGSG